MTPRTSAAFVAIMPAWLVAPRSAGPIDLDDGVNLRIETRGVVRRFRAHPGRRTWRDGVRTVKIWWI